MVIRKRTPSPQGPVFAHKMKRMRDSFEENSEMGFGLCDDKADLVISLKNLNNFNTFPSAVKP